MMQWMQWSYNDGNIITLYDGKEYVSALSFSTVQRRKEYSAGGEHPYQLPLKLLAGHEAAFSSVYDYE